MTSCLFWCGDVDAGQDVIDHLLAHYQIDKIECLKSVAHVYEDQTDSVLCLEFMIKSHRLFAKCYGPIRVNFKSGIAKSKKSNPPTVSWGHLIEEIAFEVNQQYIKTPEAHNGIRTETVSGRRDKRSPERF